MNLEWIKNRLREPTTYIGFAMVMESIGRGFPNLTPYVHGAEVILGGVAMAIKEMGSSDAPQVPAAS